MLTLYQTQTAQLLQNPAASTALYATADLTTYINRARLQLAAETECVRAYGTITLTPGTVSYSFTSIATGNAGVQGVFTVRGVTLGVALGQAWMSPRPFPYFQLYYLSNPVPPHGQPKTYSQFGQGVSGTVYLYPAPDQAYTLNVDCVCEPIPLVNDTTVEAIPYPYQEAVPYYAAYLAFLSSQRAADADRMWQEYQKFAMRARQFSNGGVNPNQYPQQPNQMRAGQLGVSQQPQQGGGNG